MSAAPPPPPPPGGGRTSGAADGPPPPPPGASAHDEHLPDPEEAVHAATPDTDHIPGEEERGRAEGTALGDHLPGEPATQPTPTSPPPGAPDAAGPSRPPPRPTPQLDDRQRPLDPRIVPLWRLSTAASVLVPGTFLTLLAGGILGARAATAVFVGVLVAAVVLVAWYPPAKYRRWRWRVTDLAIELQHGVLIRTAETLPYFRIQQIDVNQGPVDRILELASLQVTSASASGSVQLPGIPAEDAPDVRRLLLERAAAAAASDDGDGLRDAV